MLEQQQGQTDEFPVRSLNAIGQDKAPVTQNKAIASTRKVVSSVKSYEGVAAKKTYRKDL